MSTPDYPMSVARDRFGVWLHVTGLSLREVVQVLPERFAGHALLVYEPHQLNYGTSALVEERRGRGESREQLFADLMALDEGAFWNRIEPLFENESCAVWPPECLEEMIVVQGPEGGPFGVCPIPPDVVGDLTEEFVYEHPSNVAARLAFLSMDDTATSVYLADEGELLALVERVVRKALDPPPGETEGIEGVARAIRPWLEEGGVDIRLRPETAEREPRREATVALGLWSLRSQWPLLWRRVRACTIAWDGTRWALTEVREEPGCRHVSGIRLVGELFHGATRGLSYAMVLGLPLLAAVLLWVFSGPVAGVLGLLVAVVLWPRFILGANWGELRRRREAQAQRRRKYGA
jgi:hypothetical protein